DEASAVTLNAFGFEEPDQPYDVIINGTSASLQGDLPPLCTNVITAATVVYDMMYSSQTTPFNQWALDNGAVRVFDGLGMLIEQAAESFRVWRGVRPETAAVIDAMRND
ncbi:MAG: shikimate dehydrogenase, partial [Marinobacter sp.]